MVRLVEGALVSCVLNGKRSHDRRVGWRVVGQDSGGQPICSGVCVRYTAYDVEERYFSVGTSST